MTENQNHPQSIYDLQMAFKANSIETIKNIAAMQDLEDSIKPIATNDQGEKLCDAHQLPGFKTGSNGRPICYKCVGFTSKMHNDVKKNLSPSKKKEYKELLKRETFSGQIGKSFAKKRVEKMQSPK